MSPLARFTRLFAFLIAIVSFSLAGLSWWSRHLLPTPPAVALIGVELPLAGNDGAAGLASAAAVRLALDESQNGPWTGVRVEEIVRGGSRHVQNPHEDEGRDDSGEGKSASTIFNDFVRSPAQVVAAVGGLSGPIAAVLAREAEQKHLPALTIAPLPLHCNGSYAQSLWVASPAGNAAREASAVFAFARSQHYRRIAIFDDGEPEREALADCLSVLWLNHDRGSEFRFPAIRTNFFYTRALRQMALHGSDAFAYVGPESRGTLLCPARNAHMALRPDYLKSAFHRNYWSGTLPRSCGWVRRIVHSDSRPAYAAFVAHYRTRFGTTPSSEAATAYAATQIAIEAIRTANGGEAPLRDKVQRAMRERTFATILGPLHLDSHGEPDRVWFGFDKHNKGRWFTHQETAVSPKLK